LSKKRVPIDPLPRGITVFDSHCHLHFGDHYSEDLEEVIDRARRYGVARMVTIGIDVEDSRKAVALAESCDEVFATVGVHPHDVQGMSRDDYRIIERLAQSPKVVAIGEIGLDFYRNLSPREDQERHFVGQLNMARELKKPVVIHCRDAHPDLQKLMREHRAEEVGGIIHCFSGSPEDACVYLDMGFFISVAGPITYPKSELLRRSVSKIPMERLLVETDAPFLSPQPMRGKRNEPAWVVATFLALCRLKDISLQEGAKQLSSNLKEVLGA
jgi:TatD DNase family protein